jgi:hypothetical protein
MILDPRDGDAEDDVGAPLARSLMAIAGGMIAEISLIKLALAIVALIVAPGLALGFAPLVATAWFGSISAEVRAVTTWWSLALLAGLALLGWRLWRPLLRLVEGNFWSLNAILVQPAYLVVRELLRQIAARGRTSGRSTGSAIDLAAGVILFAAAGALALLFWPQTRWIGAPIDLVRPTRLIVPALSNAMVLMAAYAGVVSLIWAAADGGMERPADAAPEAASRQGRIWRIAHLSDVHVVGERYGFRIESGRKGPRGNERFHATLAKLAEIHAAEPLDVVLFSGDMTDAGRSGEWAEFLEALGRHPDLAAIAVMLPGNHDVNIIDRANPARLETPWSSARALRRVRTLSAMEAAHGARTLTAEGITLSAMAERHLEALRATAHGGGGQAAQRADEAWLACFPLLLPPASPDGLGVILLDSNADTHFSFTNALGLLTARQALAIERILAAWPEAGFVVAMHHHLVEYPGATSDLSIRIGTALINGSWVVRQLARHSARIVVMHGHRHVDWFGRCGAVRIVSAPSPVMGADDHEPSYFRIQRLQTCEGRLAVLASERVELPAVRRAGATDQRMTPSMVMTDAAGPSLS